MSTLPPVSCGAMVRIALPAMPAVGRHRADGDRAAARRRRGEQVRLAGVDPLQQLVRRRHAHHAHERRARDAHAGQLRRGGEPSAISQCTRKGLAKRSRRKPKPGMMKVKPRLAGIDRLDLDCQQIAGLGAFDVHRPGQRMDAAHLDRQRARPPSCCALIWPSRPSIVSISTVEPEAIRTAGAISGCQRLWPLLFVG